MAWNSRKWQGRWIGPAELVHNENEAPAPLLRRDFTLDSVSDNAVIYLASGGYHELYVNGIRPDDRVLAPTPSQFDKHVFYVAYKVADLLKKGQNYIEIILGNGWYDCGTATVWRTEHSPWRDTVKLCCDLEIDGKVVMHSDKLWQWRKTPIVFNELRNGETYDARLENNPPVWQNVNIVPSPGGLVVEQIAPPCRITRWVEAFSCHKIASYARVYDFNINLSGVCAISVSGPAGAEVWIDYADVLRDNGDIDIYDFGRFVKTGNFQRDRFILKGEGVETFQARFTYHGFRYAKVQTLSPEVKFHQVRAAFIHSDFEQRGNWSCSNQTLNKLQQMTLQSYKCNFVGIPTDCPHREKNGWTGDALLAMECGLWNFDCADGCREFLQTVLDTQRPSGQLPAIAPTGIFGYNYWSGPGWDSVIFEYVYRIWQYEGDTGIIEQHYEGLKRYMDYCRSMEDSDNLIDFGLGDWCHFELFKIAPVRFTSSAYYFYDLTLLAEFAELLGKQEDAAEFKARAEVLRCAINKAFPARDFNDETELTMRAAMLYFRIADADDRQRQASELAAAVRKGQHRAQFGIFGAKWVPRALAEYGYIDDVIKLFTQEEIPGWGYWVKKGESTLCECWNTTNSHNHIMFGDISAWAYEFLGGVKPLFSGVGFRKFAYAPQIPADMDSFEMSCKTPAGTIRSSWQRCGETVELTLEIPENATAEVKLPDLAGEYTGGVYKFTLPVNQK